MTRFLSLLSGFALLVVLQFTLVQSAQAQGTANAGIVLRITIDGVSTDYANGDCGYGTADWGGVVTGDFCSQVQWARDIIGNDTLVCDSIPKGSLVGKIAMVRRGACAAPNAVAGNFSSKALNAQKAGAIAVLVANNSATAGQTDCSVQSMGAGTLAASVNVPVLFLCRNIATKIDQAFKAGKTVEACFIRPNVVINSAFYPLLSAQTPISQIAVDTFGFSARLTNTKGQELKNVQLKVDVLDAANKVLFTDKLVIPSVTDDVSDSLFVMSGRYAPELPVGDYRIVYSSTSDPIPGPFNIDGERKFAFKVTNGVWAKDVTGPQTGFRPGSIPTDGWAVATYYQMIGGSKDRFQIKTVEFAHTTTASELAITAVQADVSLFRLIDNIAPNSTSFDRTAFESSSLAQLGLGNYIAGPTAQANQLQQVEITDLNTSNPGVEVFDGESYYAAVKYPGLSRFAFHAFTQDHIINLGTATFSDQWYSGGFQGGPQAVLRVYLDLISTTDEKQLAESTMKILANPIQDVLNLELKFDQATDITMTIAELSGRVIKMEDRQGVGNETLTYQFPELASGTYLARVATKEGTLTKKFVVQK